MIVKSAHLFNLSVITLFTFILLLYSVHILCISVWGLTHPTVLDPLYKMQKKVVRTITFNNKYSRTTPLFYNLRLLKIHEIHSLKLLCAVYDCKECSPLQPFSDYFIPVHSIHDHNTRQVSKGNIFISSVNIAQYGKRTAKFASSVMWNNLSPSLRECPSSRNFKRMLRELCFSLYQS